MFVRFAEDVVSLIQEQGQNQGPQLGQVEAACIVAEAPWAAAESSVLLLTSSISPLRDEVGQ